MGRSVYSFYLDHEVTRRLDEIPRGKRSRFVNDLLEKAFQNPEVVNVSLVCTVWVLGMTLTLLAAQVA